MSAETICDLFVLTPGAVRTTVSRLRKELGGALVTESQGYALHADTDVRRFQALVASAKTAAPTQAAALRREALELFAEPALAEFGDESWAMAEVARLTELRSAVVEDQISGLIAGQDYDAAIDELHRHLAEHPYRDGPHELLMQALALSGRQVEALRVFQDYRTRLIDEVGVDPGPTISELDRMISIGELVPTAMATPVAVGGTRVATRVLAPATTDLARSNLHFPPNDFIGRQSEIEAIGQALVASRLVTLLGPGGVGKTRLSYRVAAEQLDAFSDGAWVVELVNCADAAAVIRSIADVFELSDAETTEDCATQLAGHDLLLVLDNCEHLEGELTAVVGTLLSRTARLKILATSRVRLGAVGEHSINISPLRTDGEAQDLFRSRATASGAELGEADAEAIGRICERLDGIPLALELAAASCRILSPLEIVDRLEDRFALFKGGPRGSVAGRHESLRAAVDSSYDTLEPATQQFFRRLSVFAGEFPLSAAEAFADDLDESAIDLLVELIDRSLLTVQKEGGRSKYRLLETLRQYGRDRLNELDEFETSVERHVQWCLDSSARLARSAFGAHEASSLDELVGSFANYRLAVSRLLERNDDRAADLVAQFEDFSYASNSLASLATPVIDAGLAARHPASRRLRSIELVRRAVAGSTDTRRELAEQLSAEITLDDEGSVQLPVLLIGTALGYGPDPDYISQLIERAQTASMAERARLLCAAGFGSYYGSHLPEDLSLAQAAAKAAEQAGMKRLAVAAASMGCMGGLRLGQPERGATIAKPYLDDMTELRHSSIMSNGLAAIYTEAAIQAGMPPREHFAGIRHVGPNLRGDFNKLGLAMARLVQHHGHPELAIRALGACASNDRSSFSRQQRTTVLEVAHDQMADQDIESLLAAGSVSETTDLYREMWSTLEPLMVD